MIRVLIAEHYGLCRSALRLLVESAPDLEVVGEAHHGQEVIEAIDRLRPSVVVLNFMLPGVNSVDVIEHVVQSGSQTRVVVLSAHVNDSYVVESLRRGALAFVPLDAEADDFFEAIRSAAAGERFVGVDLSDRAVAAAEDGGDDPLDRLSARERQAFYLAIEGLSNAEVAERLFISPRTAEKHRARFLQKLGLRTQGDLVRFAVVRRLVPGPNGGGPVE